jgi:hypothetical protein
VSGRFVYGFRTKLHYADVRGGFDYGTVIPRFYDIALQTTDPIWLVRVPYRLVRIDSEVDSQ